MADALPIEIDFLKDKSASPERMQRAATFLYLLARSAAATKPEYEEAIRQIQAIGLDRLNEVLTPILLLAQDQAGEMQALRDHWIDGNVLIDLRALIQDEDLAPILERIGITEDDIAALKSRATASETAIAKLTSDRWFYNHG